MSQTAPATAEGTKALLDALDCLQCRAVLLEWERARLKSSNLSVT